MSRIAAYLGPPAPISTVLEEGTYPLTRQAAECADGFGVGWYPEDENPEPLLMKHRLPPWSNPGFLELARRTSTRCVVAGVRNISQGGLPDVGGIQPFRAGPYLFFHTGELNRFREVFERPMRSMLSDGSYARINGCTESELLFATWLDALGEGTGGQAMADALEQVVARVTEIAEARSALASLAIVASDGNCLVTLRTSTHGSAPTLYTIVGEDPDPIPDGGRVVATEPTFSGSWSPLEPSSLTVFDAT